MMTKILLLVMVVLLVLWLVKSARPKVQAPPPTRKAPGPAGERSPADGEVMLACAHCGLHLPRSEALPGREGVFCSEAHRAIVEAADGGA